MEITKVEYVALIKEAKPGESHVSLRSKSKPICDIAQKFGGNGHLTAAAFASNLPMPEIKKQLLSEFEKIIKLENDQ